MIAHPAFGAFKLLVCARGDERRTLAARERECIADAAEVHYSLLSYDIPPGSFELFMLIVVLDKAIFITPAWSATALIGTSRGELRRATAYHPG
jgi:hypothetical protein